MERQRSSGLVILMTTAMAASVLLQVVFGALGPFLADAMTLSRTQLGLLTTCMYLTGSVLSPAAGILVDRRGPRLPLAGLFLVSAASGAAVAASPSFTWMVAGALVGGLAVAVGNPVTNLLVSTEVPRDRQGLATGIKQSGVQLGVFVGGAGLPPLAQAAGWRVATAAAALVPLGGLALLSRTSQGGARHQRPSPSRHLTARGPLRSPLPVATRWLVAYAAGMGIGVAAMGAYLPLYGVERLGLPAAVAGLLTALLGGVGVLARIAWGRAADRAERPPAGSLRTMGALAVVSAALVGAAESGGVLLAWLGVAIAGASAAAWNAVGMLAIIRGADVAVAGRASGIVVLSFYGGFVVGPTAFGLIVDATGSYRPAWLMVMGVFAFSTVTARLWQGRTA